MIRGAIAFALVLRIDDSYTNRDVIVTTSLSLVVFTTVIFGSTVGCLGKCLFPKKETKVDSDPDLEPSSPAKVSKEDSQTAAGKKPDN